MSEYFKKKQLKKREQFHERIHAAFILSTSLNHWGKMTENEESWLAFTYPETTLISGCDQGAYYVTITPKF